MPEFFREGKVKIGSRDRAKLNSNFMLMTSIGERFNFQLIMYRREWRWYRTDKLTELLKEEKSLVSKVMNQLVFPAGKPYVSIEEDVSRCDNVAYVDFQSTILNMKVPKFRRRTVQSKPFLMGKESLLYGIYGWGFDKSYGSHVFEFLEKLMES
ncbi:unnamed protein product [Allacma fusca]|uniref:Uncharacterized protein n=1 Tax=Allacma fusca TaxID=39272 RepID=A0A8J2KA50_9HEXA|nr:unnamed protein product [Allacma fusca]